MEKIDILKIASQNPQEMEKSMESVFQTLLTLSDEEKFNNLKELITQMAEKGSDNEYLQLCKVNLKLASNLDNETLKAFLQLRLSVSSSLPKSLGERDMKFLNQALSSIDDQVRQKITTLM